MTTLFVATTGGHLDQLHHFAGRLPDDESFWITFDNAQSRSLLAGRDVRFVDYVGVRDLPSVLRCVADAHRLRGGRPITRAVSTGSAIAVGYLPYLASRGVDCHYIESAARVSSPSLTGRLLQRAPRVKTYTQYPQWAGRRWSYVGSVFDAYEPEPATNTGSGTGTVRVVVTVGTATEFTFRRLFDRLWPLLAEDGPVATALGRPVEVLWQTGGTPTEGLPITATPFLPASELAAAVAAADIVVSHAGTGSALAALNARKYPLLAPRLQREGEAGDDHQHELADELRRRGLAACRDASEIGVDDLLGTMTTAIRRVAAPPPMLLG